MQKPFYGWIIVGVTFLIGITESGAVQGILSIFMKPMIEEFGWSRTVITGGIALGSLCAGFLSPLVGPLLDRHGPRMVAFWSVLIMSAGLICMTFIDSIWQFYLFFGGGRMIAVGVLGLVIPVTVSNWFLRKRGRALGIAWLGPRFGSVLMPLLCQFVILNLGWRIAWGVLGVVIFIISGIPALLFLRRRPEDIGLLPDGALPDAEVNRRERASPKAKTEAHGAGLDPVWMRSLALRTKTFWEMTFVSSLLPFSQAGISFHIFPYLTDKGLEGMTAVWVLSIMAAAAGLGSVIWGLLAERFHLQRLLAANAFISAPAFLLMFWAIDFKVPHIIGIIAIFALAALNGALHGGRHPIVDSLWPQFFGRSSLGSILGVANPFRFTTNAMGPIVAALFFDVFNSYAVPFYLFCCIYILVGIVSLFMKPPRYPLSKISTGDIAR